MKSGGKKIDIPFLNDNEEVNALTPRENAPHKMESNHWRWRPPSTGKDTPVMKDALGEQRKETT